MTFWCRPWGFKRGFRNWYRVTGLPFWARSPFSYALGYGHIAPQRIKELEMEYLEREAKELEGILKDIKERLAKLKEES